MTDGGDDVLGSAEKIERGLQLLSRSTLLLSLQPGIEPDQTWNLLHLAGLNVGPDLPSLYAWRNGTSTVGDVLLGDISLFPGYYLLSLQDALANYDAFVSDARWSHSWLPVFADGGGDFYVVECGAGAAHPVRHFRIDEREHPIEFNSLSDMLRTIAQGFERSVFFVTEDNYLEMDQDAFDGLAAELNSSVTWWDS